MLDSGTEDDVKKERRRLALLKEFDIGPDGHPLDDPAAWWRTVVVSVCIFFFVASMPLPAIYFVNSKNTVSNHLGLILLLFGWCSMEVAGGVAWAANGIFVVAIYFMRLRSDVSAFLAACLACYLSANTYLLTEVVINEAGMRGPVVRFGIAHHLWQIAMTLTVVGSAMLIVLTRMKAEICEMEPEER